VENGKHRPIEIIELCKTIVEVVIVYLRLVKRKIVVLRRTTIRFIWAGPKTA